MVTKRKNPEDFKPLGRPCEFTQEMADHICELTATTGCGLMRLTKLYPELPDKQTINRWRYRFPSFSSQYAKAKLIQADRLAEECLEIADDSSEDSIVNDEGKVVCNVEYINRCRLRIDTRKWLASKLLPKQYGHHADEVKSASESLVEKLIEKLVDK